MDLKQLLKQRALIFDRAINGNLTHRDPKAFYDALRYVPLSGGKRLRPILTMLSCEAVGGIPEKTIPLGLALEYLHNSTLVHDDIIDGDDWRRGLPTTNQKFGLPYAILAGDALIGETYQMLSYLAPPELNAAMFKEIIRSIADASKRFYEGEAMDIEFNDRFDVTIPEYMIMIEKKTGQLYWLAGKGGALIGKGSKREVQALADFGLLFGIIFQIKDDLLNLQPNQATLGKQHIGSDIINGKRTLMVIHALTQVNATDKKILTSILGNQKATQKDVQTAIHLFQKYGSIEFAEQKMMQLQQQAEQRLAILKENHAKQALIALNKYSITREY